MSRFGHVYLILTCGFTTLRNQLDCHHFQILPFQYLLSHIYGNEQILSVEKQEKATNTERQKYSYLSVVLSGENGRHVATIIVVV